VQATERGYTDALTGEICYTYHARLDSLEPGTTYGYEVLHDGAPPAQGTFRTGPRGRSRPFRFTSFGDQGVPAPVGLGLGPNSPNAGYVVDAVESLEPLFHLANGDLAYGNISDQPAATWESYFRNIERSARFRPWMPALGNHENESGNGPQGYLAYLTRFELPANGSAAFAGNWYAFTVGSALVISLNNDDVCLQDGGFSSYRRDHMTDYGARGVDPYISGYSGGRQRAWLERTLASARASGDIDWIIVCMHQVAISSAHFNGADLGIRRNWLPLFDAYGVDLVLAGHEHIFERTYPLRGVVPGTPLLTPSPHGSDPAEMDPRQGTVHLTIGGGGHPVTEASSTRHGPDEGMLITAVGDGDPWHQRPAEMATEPAEWSAYQGEPGGFGFAACDVVPEEAGGTTSITVTYYAAAAGSPDYRPADSFVLRKPLGKPLPSEDPCDRELTWAARQ
jgi:3',5'-cyclic AMP phosphodiesterase CpdA